MKLYTVGETTELIANFFDENDDPRDPDTVTGKIRLPDESEVDLDPVRTDVGVYAAMFTPSLAGLHQYRFDGEVAPLSSAVEGVFMATTEFPS